jgi:hypothetical protein
MLYPHLKAFDCFLPNTEQLQGFPRLVNDLILSFNAVLSEEPVRQQGKSVVPLAIVQFPHYLQKHCQKHFHQRGKPLTGNRRSNGLPGGSSKEGIVRLLELASQACGEGSGQTPWEMALRSVRVLDREKGSTVAAQGGAGEKSVMMGSEASVLIQYSMMNLSQVANGDGFREKDVDAKPFSRIGNE